jgi:monothiol glutaredoxin
LLLTEYAKTIIWQLHEFGSGLGVSVGWGEQAGLKWQYLSKILGYIRPCLVIPCPHIKDPILHIEVVKMDVLDTIKQQISENAVILYMKGSPSAPQCGFSQRASQALMACGQRFAYVDILSNPEIRSELPKYANWPTFPQLWVKGELIGGCDIITEMNENGELKPLIDAAIAG